jgi:hypothetical protein
MTNIPARFGGGAITVARIRISESTKHTARRIAFLAERTG